MSLADQLVTMVNGSSVPLREFECEMPERSEQGRHFRGDTTIIYDTNHEDVAADDRGYWMTEGFYDADWGISPVSVKKLIKLRKYSRLLKLRNG